MKFIIEKFKDDEIKYILFRFIITLGLLAISYALQDKLING